MDFKKLLLYVEDHKDEHLTKTIADNERKISIREAKKNEEAYFISAANIKKEVGSIR